AADRLVDAEGPRPHARGLAQLAAAAELVAQVVGQRAQVGPLRTADEDAHVEQRALGRLHPGPERGQPRLVDVDLARGALDLLAGAGQFVEPLAVDLARRIHRRRLLDEADEAAQ